MELKCGMDKFTGRNLTTFNRTAYGIEMAISEGWQSKRTESFNRTAYGIEIH